MDKAITLEAVVEMAQKLEDADKILLMEQVIQSLKKPVPVGDKQGEPVEDEVWDEDELQELLNNNQPMTGREIVEAGLLGAWKDLGIEDSLEWVQAQRAKTKGRYSW